MTVKISSIADAGNFDKERVVLRATSASNIGAYALFRGNSSDTGDVLSGDIPYVYWFQDQDIGAGDLVVLYSKSGIRKEKKNENGTTSHFFYWGLSSAIWVQGAVPALVETVDWSTGKPIK